MPYVMSEAMEAEENAIFAQKSTILDGRRRRPRRRRRENVEIKPPQPPVGVGDRLGLSSAMRVSVLETETFQSQSHYRDRA